MNQILGLGFFFALLAGTLLVLLHNRTQRRDVESLLRFSEGPDARSLLLYKALTLQTQHAFHLLLALASAGGWLIPWWGLASSNSALIRRLEEAAVKN